MIQNFIEFVRDKAFLYKDNVFLCDFETGRSITYLQFDEITDRLAYGFKALGLKKGDRVALLHPNQSDFILCYVGVIKADGIIVPINSLYTTREIQFILNDAEAKILVTTDVLSAKIKDAEKETPSLQTTIVKEDQQSLEEALLQMIGPLKTIDLGTYGPNDPTVIFYTSGTTGTPKGVILSHRNLTFGGANVAQNYGLRGDDVTIAVLPLVHVFANASPVLGSLSSGGQVVVQKKFSADHVYEAIERYKVSWFPGVPTMFNHLLSDFPSNRRDLSSLRMGLSGGASLPTESLRAFEDTFNAKILEVYGLTESTGLVTANPVFGIRKAGSIGITVSGVETKVVDKSDKACPQGEVGELVFKGPNATIGYWNRPDETRNRIRNGWVHTGDHVYQDEDGYFYLVGRENELIISGGYNIYPKEIEEVLSSHPAAHEVAVIGMPDQNKGEILKAFIVLEPGAEVEEEVLQGYCSRNLAPYKIPKFEIIEELPKNPVGKIDKRKLQRR